MLGTAAYIVTWYFDAYVIVSRLSFVHGDSGLSIYFKATKSSTAPGE